MREKFEAIKEKTRPFLIGVAAGLILFGIAKLIFNPVVVEGTSMEPTYKEGNVLSCTAAPAEGSVNRGDIAVISKGYMNLIKRVVAIPGDKIVVHKGKLYVNDELSPYQFEDILIGGVIDETEVTLGSNEYFAMGDNRNNSYDCRDFGPVQFNDIKCLVKSKII